MAEERKVVETKVSVSEAYQKCFERATQLGLNIKTNISGQRLEIEKVNRTALWWVCVVLGFCFYIVPGVLVLVLWKPVEYCHLVFDENGSGAILTGMVKGESGLQFWSKITGILL